jgi:hypothetical protein
VPTLTYNLKPQTWCPWPDCLHHKCMLYRGEITVEQYLADLVDFHWDDNWGRFEHPEDRRRIHALLIDETLRTGRVDEEGYPEINIMVCVYASVLPKEKPACPTT